MSSHILKVSRLEGLHDGIFAIAMTIMVLNLHVPEHMQTDDVLPLIRSDLYVNLCIYVGSFIILGTHWIAMNFQIGMLERLNRTYLWANMFYLMCICIIPFSANLLGVYPYSADSIHFYAANLIFSSLGQFVTLECAGYYNLYKGHIRKEIRRAALGRIVIGPVFCILAVIVAQWNVKIAFGLLVAPTIIYLVPGKIDRYEEND